MTSQTAVPKRNSEAGFTLVEASIATLILMFGLASIFNLMIVATTTNNVANRASAATLIASQRLEVLRATPYNQLLAQSQLGAGDTLTTQTAGFFTITNVEGVGQFETRWILQTLGNPQLMFLHVRTEPGGFRGRQARADFTTIRSCTLGVPAGC